MLGMFGWLGEVDEGGVMVDGELKAWMDKELVKVGLQRTSESVHGQDSPRQELLLALVWELQRIRFALVDIAEELKIRNMG